MDLHRKLLERGKPMALYIEGELLVRNGRLDAGLRILKRAYDELNDSVVWWPDVCSLLGSAYAEKGDYEVALEYWQRAAKEGSTDALRGIYQNTADKVLRDDCLYKLACKGDTVALHEIAAVEQGKLEENKFETTQDKVFQEKWAKEWAKMAELDWRSRHQDPTTDRHDSGSEGMSVEFTEEQMRELQAAVKAAKEKQRRSEQ